MGENQSRQIMNIFIIIVTVIVVLIGGVAVYGYTSLNRNIEREEIGDIGISQDVLEYKQGHDVINIALFGVDSREGTYDYTRSDAMLVFSFNRKTNEAFITSIVRDTYVFIDEAHGYEKINHAYAYGGAKEAIETLNKNFDMDIDRYVTVNFDAVEHVIDELDGVEIEVKDYELDELNRVIEEMNDEGIGTPSELVSTTGVQTLNGKQAVAYMRIRKIGNGDYERMERQRVVLSLTMQKLLSFNKMKLVSLVDDFLPYIKTNLSTSEIIGIGTQFLFANITDLQQLQLPSNEYSVGKILYDDLYYLIPNTLEDNVMEWHESVYGIEDYEVTETAKEISYEISKFSNLD
ncbi:MAG TPA: LytR family transcriptional regulator [Firmicutes bacterium]|nr:LytR family transcriptional regulator [Bacillota bacterium]